MTIRLARTEEHLAVAECVNAAYSKYIERLGKEPAPMLADYPSLIAKGLVFVISDYDEVRGVLVMIPEPETNSLFVENIAVHPKYQGQGLGRTLMAFAEQCAREKNLREIHLYTNELMTENLLLYRHWGFEEVERQVGEGYRRIFLRKILS